MIDMIFLHDKLCLMEKLTATLTERGQVSVPAVVRKRLHLHTGQQLVWEMVSDHECRVLVIDDAKPIGAKKMLGFARRFRRKARTTKDWMEELREGER